MVKAPEGVLFDDVDLDLIEPFSWYLIRGRHTHYAVAHDPNRHSRLIRMHRLITGFPVVDHINGNGLDNRRANLRDGSGGVNARNRRLSSNNGTGVSGVVFRPNHGLKGTYVATWMEDGRLRTRSFACAKHGKQEALDLAVGHRRMMERKLGILTRS